MSQDKPGLAVADYYRAEAKDDRGPWQGVTQTCVECERPTIEHLVDMRCASCNGTVPDDTEYRKAARLALYERTAKKCREWGDVEGAEWFEEKVRKGDSE